MCVCVSQVSVRFQSDFTSHPVIKRFHPNPLGTMYICLLFRLGFMILSVIYNISTWRLNVQKIRPSLSFDLYVGHTETYTWVSIFSID